MSSAIRTPVPAEVLNAALRSARVRVPAAVLHAAMREIESAVREGLDLTSNHDLSDRVGRDDHILEERFKMFCAGVIIGAGEYYEAAIIERPVSLTVAMLRVQARSTVAPMVRLYIFGIIKGFAWRAQQEGEATSQDSTAT